MVSNSLKNRHLMWRAGFGPAAEQLQQLNTIDRVQLWQALQKKSLRKPEYIDVADDYLKGLVQGVKEEIHLRDLKDIDGAQKKIIQQKQRESIKNLNLNWLNQMVDSEAQLREKMALFWHGHFASRNINVFYQQQLLDIIRQNALESFRDLLHEVSKSAAILNFLNANQNRKAHANENFARELMELFTIGIGNYSETDVKEAARAFTGWGADFKGNFIERSQQRDQGNKTVFGKTGNFDGDNLIDILLDQEQTSKFITEKIYRFFVNDSVDKKKVAWLSSRFYKNNYHIGKLMEDIFTSEWFYHQDNIGVHVKSPVELLVGIRRLLPMKLEQEEAQLMLQRVLGQILFYPPNVAGWPGGKAWIDSSTLMMRMRIGQMISDQDEFNVRLKTDDDQMMGHMEENKETQHKNGFTKNFRPIKAKINWMRYLKNFEDMPRDILFPVLTDTLLQVSPSFDNRTLIHFTDDHSRESYIQSATLQIMSTPEYQLS
ncbi:MAG: DUF1800 domain-containing protein [Flavisolibacter sp.]